MIVEGCVAKVSDNNIQKNLKANIAYGGKNSGQSKIEHNMISGSVSEGVFLVEGEENAMISENTIFENKDGIVM